MDYFSVEMSNFCMKLVRNGWKINILGGKMDHNWGKKWGNCMFQVGNFNI